MIPFYLEQALGYIDVWLERQTQLDTETPGYVVAVAHDGQVIYNRAFGLADVASDTAMTPAHVFRAASHSKTFAATAVMQLAATGKIAGDAPVAAYLPFLKENPDPRMAAVTVADLLRHTAGVTRDSDDASFWRLQRDFPSRAAVVAHFKTAPPVIARGTRFKYSNYAYALLGEMIETVTGMAYPDYIREKIIVPLGLTQTAAICDDALGVYATGYTRVAPNGKRGVIAAQRDTAGLTAAAGVCATAADLCRFYAALMPGSDALLPDAMKQEMLRQHVEMPVSGGGQGYGLGLLRTKLSGRDLVGHGGSMPAHLSRTLCDPAAGIVVSVMANSYSGRTSMCQTGIWHIVDYFHRHVTAPSSCADCAGVFYDAYGVICCVPAGDVVALTTLDEPEPFKDAVILTPVAPDRFTITQDTGYGSYGQDVVFIRNDAGEVQTVNYAGITLRPRAAHESYIDELNAIYAAATIA